MRRAAGWVLVGLCLVASAAPARATDFVVTKTTDSNDGSCDADCSLREAIVAANASAGPDRHIVLASNATYTLSLGPRDPDGMVVPGSGDLDITGALTIDGHGSTIDGGHIDRVLDIQGEFPVTLNDLTIQHGTGIFGLGGGIWNGATLTLNRTTVTDNHVTGFAGGIFNYGQLTLNRSTVSRISAEGRPRAAGPKPMLLRTVRCG